MKRVYPHTKREFAPKARGFTNSRYGVGVYLDYAASTPVDPRVVKAMMPYFAEKFGNPHALHSFGQEASRAVFVSRQTVARAIGADYKETIFTGSATEANNLALRGVMRNWQTVNSNLGTKKPGHPRMIVSAIEHESVLNTCKDLEKDGVEVIYIPVGKDGIVDSRKIKAALNERTILVSVMHANNEVGTIQPILEISKIIADFRGNQTYPLFHTDAVQSFQYLDCDVNRLGVDLMTLSAHKIYGPKGIGALFVRQASDACALLPIITGSGQEFGLRSGTDNVPYIVGFAKAVEVASKMRNSENKRIKKLRDYFWKRLSSLRGAEATKQSYRSTRLLRFARNDRSDGLPNILNIYFPGQKAHDLQMKLDLAGVAVSPGAACSTRVSKASYVLEEMGSNDARASGSLRFSLGRQTNKADINYAIDKIRSSMLQSHLDN